MGDGEQVGVHQQSCVSSIEGGEHLADGWDLHLVLMEHLPLLREEEAQGDGGVGVGVWVMVQSDHVALSDIVEEDRGEEGEEADDAAEGSLQGDALDS